MSANPSAEVPVRGERLFAALERLFQVAERRLGRLLPEPLNPLLQTGAIANISLAIAVVTGVLLLFWYTPNVSDAYASVLAMAERPWTAGLLRSMHRYSSDAGLMFASLHGLRLLLARRFTGARWVAWVTGMALVGLMWVVGWMGYWLVWDQRGQQVATGSAKMLDALPIFAIPMSRSFLADGTLNSLLFFVVFFIHMLLPMAMAVLLWLHIMRVARSRFFTPRPLTLAIVACTLALSLALPASTAPQAQLSLLPQGFTADIWYLMPLLFTDRLGAGVLWGCLLTATLVVGSLPWTLAGARVRVAEVTESRCQGCRLCSIDCPYEAIQRVKREAADPMAHMRPDEPAEAPDPDLKRTHDRSIVARIDPSLCVGCGICAGSCDSAAIGLSWFPVLDQRKAMDKLLVKKSDIERNEDPGLAVFVCAEVAPALGALDEQGQSARLPGYRVQVVPCAAWLHPLSLERAVRHGAPGVVVATCASGSCRFREGADHTAERVSGAREPSLRPAKDGPLGTRVLPLDPTDPAPFFAAAQAHRRGELKAPTAPSAARIALGAALAALVLTGGVYALSDLPYRLPPGEDGSLVVSFAHAGGSDQRCRPMTDAEKASLPVHMQAAQVCERGRPPVHLQVEVDGVVTFDGSFAPRGLWGDGPSVAMERVSVAPGPHEARVRIADQGDGAWNYEDHRTIQVGPRAQIAVLFDKSNGFVWYGVQ